MPALGRPLTGMPTLTLAEIGIELSAILRERNLRISELEMAVRSARKHLSRDEVTQAERLLAGVMGPR